MKLSICKVSIAYIMVLCGGVLYLSSMIIVKVDSNFDYRWAVFWLHIFSCLFIFISYLLLTSARSIKKLFSKKDVYLLLFISIITYLSNFTLLSIYPFVSISDELRDGGLFAMKIASGIVKNIFGYGSYGAHGLIIPTFIIPFYYIFSNSTLTYRLPAALLSSIDVLLLYILLTRVVNRQAAFWSSIVLATLPLHMFFAHTQVVVAFNFFWVPILLLILFNLFKNNRVIDYIFFGTVLGFVFEFHAAIRSFSLLICLFVILFLVKKILFDNARFLQKVKTSINKLFFLVLFTFVGFGPMLLFTTPQDFFHASRLISISPSMHSLLAIKNNYITSLLVYFYEPTSFFYADHKPIFSPILSIFFFAGLIYSFFVLKNYFLNILISLLILLPFLNSAITDSINADHRVSLRCTPLSIHETAVS